MKVNQEKLPIRLMVLPVFVKGFSVFYFVLLPIFYAEQLITVKQVGYIGATYFFMAIAGSLLVARRLHALRTDTLMKLSAWVTFLATIMLFGSNATSWLALLVVSYMLMGTATGAAMSGINALAASNTVKGDRFKSLATLGMLTDVVRIVFPLLAAAAVAFGKSRAAIILVLISNAGFLLVTYSLGHLKHAPHQVDESFGSLRLRRNKTFKFILRLEFLDSFASSQLFVFIPILFLAKGYTLENTLVFQSLIFLGYLSGRWVIGRLATKYTGLKAIALAEVGMILTITLLLLATQIEVLYTLSFMLGIFTRGTSPAIKAISFDSLEDHQLKQGSAWHILAGESGGAFAQLAFGLLVAWLGVTAPFIAAIAVGFVIIVICFGQLTRHT